MEIVQENGKDYLVTFFAKIDNTKIDTTPFFTELEECRLGILRQFNKEHHTHYDFLDKGQYGYNLQAITNRFSGNYFSPSFMKSYMANPATCFYSMLLPEESNTATDIGSTVHKILELYYLQPKDLRNHELLDSIANETIREDQDRDRIITYINGYKSTPHYLAIPDTELECRCELSGRSNIYVKQFGQVLPTCSYVIDRIDIVGDDLYVVDYKTGSVSEKNTTFDGNLGQLLLYKLLVDNLYEGKTVKGVYICAPGIKKYLPCDCSLGNQQILINDVMAFFDKFRNDNSRRVYQYTDAGYFSSRLMQEFREIMNDDSIKFAKIPVKVYIGESKA